MLRQVIAIGFSGKLLYKFAEGLPSKRVGPKDSILINYIYEEVLTMSEITAPMGGKIIDVKVKPGDAVNEGDEVIILEAMKMELPVVANESGTVKEVKCNSGDAVEAESVLVVLE